LTIGLSVTFVVFLLEIGNCFIFPVSFLFFIHLLIIHFRITKRVKRAISLFM
jgi:hypothetical protein